MWHEARKQERRIRGLIVDYRRRAERRQDFYEKIQADPTQFIQIHGRRCKIHLDPAVSAAGDGAAIIVPWQGQHDNLIDRFDVRAHLDYIPVVTKSSDNVTDISQEERQCNYERYRILAQNDFLNIPEEKFLHQLYLEEQFGANAHLDSQSNQGKKKSQKSGAAIGYSYDDSTENTQESQHFAHLKHSTSVGIPGGSLPSPAIPASMKTENESESDSDSDMDMDVSIEVSKLDTNQAHELNACGRNYGMLSNDFYSYLTKDADEADALRLAREEEREKILLGGRKSRRERRAQKERRIARRPFSPPSYAAKEDNIGKDEDSESRSPSPSDTTEKITYITSFGGEDELQPHSKITITLGKGSSTLGASCVDASTSAAGLGQATYAQKVKENLEKLKQSGGTLRRKDSRSQSNSRSRSRSRTPRRSRRSVRKSRSRSASYKRHRRIDKKRSKSRSRSRSRSRSTNKIRSSYTRRHRESNRRSTSRSRSQSNTRTRRRRYNSFSPSSTERSPVQSLRTNNKSTRISKHSPKNSLSTIHKSRSSSYSSARQIKTPTVKEEDKSSRKSVETAADIVTCSTILTSPLKLALTNPQSALTPSESTLNLQSLPVLNVIEPPPPPLKRYYGRKKDEYSSSENNSESDNNGEDDSSSFLKTNEATDTQDQMEVDSTSEKSNHLPSTSTLSYKGKPQSHPQQTGKYGSITSSSNAPETKASTVSGTGVGSSSGRLNLRERLKRKMQNLLNKQYKADKKAEIEKTERERQLQQEREEEMRELSIKLRRRQRALRHRYGSQNSKESESENSDTLLATRSKRSKSGSSDRSSIKITRRRSRDRKRHSPSTTKGSPCRDRRRSPSRPSRHARSRSQSRNRRSSSKRRRRSVSRSRRHREQSYERSSRYTERSRYEDRNRRSISRSGRDRDHDRERNRERESIRYRDRDRDSDRQKYWGSSASDRHRSERSGDGRERFDRDRHNRDRQQNISSSTTSSTSAGVSRSRVVISAPPKLKKLVDY